jgi:hypothetical protein
VSAREIAALVTAAARAQLAVAFERGEATAENLDAIARAIGNGAAQAMASEDE